MGSLVSSLLMFAFRQPLLKLKPNYASIVYHKHTKLVNSRYLQFSGMRTKIYDFEIFLRINYLWIHVS